MADEYSGMTVNAGRLEELIEMPYNPHWMYDARGYMWLEEGLYLRPCEGWSDGTMLRAYLTKKGDRTLDFRLRGPCGLSFCFQNQQIPGSYNMVLPFLLTWKDGMVELRLNYQIMPLEVEKQS